MLFLQYVNDHLYNCAVAYNVVRKLQIYKTIPWSLIMPPYSQENPKQALVHVQQREVP